MANTAGSDLATAPRLAVGRVTRVALVMRGDGCRNRKRKTPVSLRAVTARASILRTSRRAHVLRMIEFHIEAFPESCREASQRRFAATGIRVANEAHRHRRCSELSKMATSTLFVSGKPWQRRVIRIAFMTGGAGEGTMTLTRVQEL